MSMLVEIFARHHGQLPGQVRMTAKKHSWDGAEGAVAERASVSARAHEETSARTRSEAERGDNSDACVVCGAMSFFTNYHLANQLPAARKAASVHLWKVVVMVGSVIWGGYIGVV